MLWTDKRTSASNGKNNMEGYTCDIQHLRLPNNSFIKEHGNKRKLRSYFTENNVYTRLKQSTSISQMKLYSNYSLIHVYNDKY